MMQSPNLVARPHFQMLFHMIYRMCLFLGLIHIIAYCNANYSRFNEVNGNSLLFLLPMANLHCYLFCVNKSSAQIHIGF